MWYSYSTKNCFLFLLLLFRFTEIFSSRSYKHLSEMFVKYKEVSNGSTIEEVIKKEMSSDRKVAFLTIGEAHQTHNS